MINGQVIRKLRRQQKLSQKEVASRLGISPSAYAQLEQSAWIQGEKLQTLIATLHYTLQDVEKAMDIRN